MSRIAAAVKLLRVYFWFLVAVLVIGGVYVINEVILQSGTIGSGYYAIGGFAALMILLFLTFRRFAR